MLAGLALGLQLTATAQVVDLNVTNLDTKNGQIVLGIYKDQTTWEAEKAAIVKYYPKGDNVFAGVLKVSITLDPGTYGFTMLDDENSDNKMNYNWLGMPKEGFGFSNIYFTGLTKPKFDLFKFTISKGQRVAVTMKVRYM